MSTLPSPVLCPDISNARTGISHGFFTRNGGTSNGIYRSLNVGLGSRDDQQSVAANRQLICSTLGADEGRLATVNQVHSADVAVADQAWKDDRPRADAIVTNTPGLAIGILTADCGPVLFADAEAGIVGAAHAGWKGAMDGVLENTISAMEKLGARRSNITATLGPCISQKNYEVGPEYIATFLAHDADNQQYFVPSGKDGHHLFDLPSYVVDRLKVAGVKARALNLCTYADADRYYSYRRSVHKNEPDYGRQISAIMLK